MGQAASSEPQSGSGSEDGDVTHRNTFTDTLVLRAPGLQAAHADSVRCLAQVSDDRIATGSDDTDINIWCTQTGRLCVVLSGHNLPVTCLLTIDQNTLFSGSSDKTIRIWNPLEGSCTRVLTGHTNGVKCLVRLRHASGGDICSGGNDKDLRVWTISGQPVRAVEREDGEETLHMMLAISRQRVVTCSQSRSLYIYNMFKGIRELHPLVVKHNSVQWLAAVSDISFASAASDGTIAIWNCSGDKITESRKLQPHITAKLDRNDIIKRPYLYSAQHICMLNTTNIAAAIGNGFAVFEVQNGDCLVRCADAHDAQIVQVAPLHSGSKIVTASADATIKIWSYVPRKAASSLAKRLQADQNAVSLGFGVYESESVGGRMQAVCIGELVAHSGSVNMLVPLAIGSFVSIGADRSAIVWKDQSMQRARLRAAATEYMRAASRQVTGDVRFGAGAPGRLADGDGNVVPGSTHCDVETLGAHGVGSESGGVFDPADDTSGRREQLQVSERLGVDPADGTNIVSPVGEAGRSQHNRRGSVPVRVPQYIIDSAETLVREDNCTIEDVRVLLLSQEHSPQVVDTVCSRLSSMTHSCLCQCDSGGAGGQCSCQCPCPIHMGSTGTRVC